MRLSDQSAQAWPSYPKGYNAVIGVKAAVVSIFFGVIFIIKTRFID
jgi:hypothetical protein